MERDAAGCGASEPVFKTLVFAAPMSRFAPAALRLPGAGFAKVFFVVTETLPGEDDRLYH